MPEGCDSRSGMWHRMVVGGSWSAPDRIRKPSKQAITPTNGCGDKSAFSHMATREIWSVSVMVNRGKEIPTVSSLGHPEPCGKRGAFYGHHGCVFWRLLVLPSTAKVITLRTKTQLVHHICFEITSRLRMPSMMWWIWPISGRLAWSLTWTRQYNWRWT